MVVVESAGITDVGKRRKGNEDALYVDDSKGLYLVSDGIGGHRAGEVASELVMILGVLVFLPLIGRIQGSGMAVEVALNQVLPALFGALGGIFLFRSPKLGLVPLVLAFAIAFIKNDLPYSIVIPPMVAVSVITARIMYKRKWVKGEGMI